MENRPYVDLENIRTFDANIDPIHLQWHRDNEDRKIEVLECGEGWQFQFDDQLPITLQSNTILFIKRHHWHRVIKGQGSLKIKIEKYESV